MFAQKLVSEKIPLGDILRQIGRKTNEKRE